MAAAGYGVFDVPRVGDPDTPEGAWFVWRVTVRFRTPEMPETVQLVDCMVAVDNPPDDKELAESLLNKCVLFTCADLLPMAVYKHLTVAVRATQLVGGLLFAH